jgi:hypothetical protein
MTSFPCSALLSLNHGSFGGDDDVCFEKRVFYRLMSGLQASISTHIAREYYWPETGWGTNIPLFVKAVGSHPDRLHNLYFTFLVLLRALSKAQDALLAVDYNTGNPKVNDCVFPDGRAVVFTRFAACFLIVVRRTTS